MQRILDVGRGHLRAVGGVDMDIDKLIARGRIRQGFCEHDHVSQDIVPSTLCVPRLL